MYCAGMGSVLFLLQALLATTAGEVMAEGSVIKMWTAAAQGHDQGVLVSSLDRTDKHNLV